MVICVGCCLVFFWIERREMIDCNREEGESVRVWIVRGFIMCIESFVSWWVLCCWVLFCLCLFLWIVFVYELLDRLNVLVRVMILEFRMGEIYVKEWRKYVVFIVCVFLGYLVVYVLFCFYLFFLCWVCF